ncbi:cell wall-associated NlpC family hydrolase [Rubricella aquisinus]|uniref:Cell wall-associated NlpC family hydrolase n=1 Tax=Rubricella aquisinus TaxID=2028108 RepID=A0A840WSQ4_9RHOB|nr:NlpC/P60 family protein [Rubricella aquisinus]MBB5514240.1 cell wall-associated NlpC family hydrolase [Rubricella aquisinus]
MKHDPRLTPARPDIAAAHLSGTVNSDRFVEGRAMRVALPLLPLTMKPDPEAPLDTQLLFGEVFTVYDVDDNTGLAWGQSGRDGYVGWVPHAGLEPPATPTHHVTQPLALLYAEPEMKGRPVDALPYLAQVEVIGQSGRWLELAEGGWLPGRHLSDAPDRGDWVTLAERFTDAPYLWGGRSVLGLDCSALVQLARMGAGHDCPRDSDMQQALGAALPLDGPFQRGDLMFWKGHVGIMLDAEIMLHANAFHMAVRQERLTLARDRIAAQGDGPMTAARRLS